MHNFNKILKKYSSIKRKEESSTFMEICKYPGSRFEEVCTRILKFYISPENPHRMNHLVIKSLLSLLKDTSNYNLSELNIEIEQYAAKKRIDMIIEGDDFVIGIENKIFAPLYNKLSLYREKIRAYKKPNEHCLVLTLRKLSEVEKTEAKENDFIEINYLDFFNVLKQNIENNHDNFDNQHYIFLLDFIRTIENLTLSNMDLEQFNFFRKNSDLLDKLTKDYNTYKKNISDKQKLRIGKIHSKIKKKTVDTWWVYHGYDLGIKLNSNDFQLGVESWFKEDSSSPFAKFIIVVTTWKRKDWGHFESEINEQIKKGKSKINGSKNFKVYKEILNGTDEVILTELQNAYLMIKKIVDKKENSL